MEQNNLIKNLLMLLAGLTLIFASVYLVLLSRNAWKTYDYIGKTPDLVNQITVSGTAKVTAIPDVAIINLGIVNDGATVALAQKGVTDKMNNIINSLKNDFKIDSKDIKTENYSIQPKYDWSDGKQKIIGYTANQSVQVKIRDFDKTGNILAKTVELGANNVYGPNFIIDDPEKAKAEAREKAITQAKEKAKLLADQIGIKLGKIVNFYEDGGNYVANAVYGLGGSDEALKTIKSPTPTIEAGSQDIQLTVSISYEIK